MADDNLNPTRPPSKAESDAAYDKIDRYLRNNLDDSDYAEHQQALELVYAAGYAGPAKFTPAEIARGNVGIRWVHAAGVAGRPTLHDVLDYLDERAHEADGGWEDLDSAGGLAVRLLARMTVASEQPAGTYSYDRMHIGRDAGAIGGKLATREIQRSPAFRADDEWFAYAKQVCAMLNAAEEAGRLMDAARKVA